MRDHQRWLDKPMTDGAALQRPFDVARTRYHQTALLLLDNVEKGGGRSPDDLDAAVLHLAIDMQMAAGDHGHTVAEAGFEQPLTRRIGHRRRGEAGVICIILERR